MFYVIRDSFPNGEVRIHSQRAHDMVEQYVNVIIDECDTLEEAKGLKQKLIETEVDGFAGKDQL